MKVDERDLSDLAMHLRAQKSIIKDSRYDFSMGNITMIDRADHIGRERIIGLVEACLKWEL